MLLFLFLPCIAFLKHIWSTDLVCQCNSLPYCMTMQFTQHLSLDLAYIMVLKAIHFIRLHIIHLNNEYVTTHMERSRYIAYLYMCSANNLPNLYIQCIHANIEKQKHLTNEWQCGEGACCAYNGISISKVQMSKNGLTCISDRNSADTNLVATLQRLEKQRLNIN